MRENIFIQLIITVFSDTLDVKIKQRKLVNKSDIDKKLININKKFTSNKTKHIEADKTALTK